MNKKRVFVSDNIIEEIINEKLEKGEEISEELENARNCMENIHNAIEQEYKNGSRKRYSFSDFFTDNNISAKFENNKGLLKYVLESCAHILTNGKNKGSPCGKNNCKKHSGTPCNFILKNKKVCNRFYCKKHESG